MQFTREIFSDGNWEAKLKALQEELERQKKECQDTIAALKAQYDRDMKNLHTKHNESVAKLQTSHEEIVKKVHEESEKEIETLRTELVSTKSQMDDQQCTCGPPLESVIKKIMENGMGVSFFITFTYI